MDLQLSPEQESLDDSLRRLFAQHAGLERARQLNGSLDTDLMTTLAATGYLDAGYEAGPIEALLVAERAAEAAACAPITTRALVGPLAGIANLPPLLGLVSSPNGLVRYAGHCDAYLVLDNQTAHMAIADDVEVDSVASPAAFPLGRVTIGTSVPLTASSGPRLRRAWQIAIAAEIGSMALAAVRFSAEHVSGRHQFDRPIGSFQAVQHRLARCHGMAEATRWLARRAAWNIHDEFLSASAAAFACETAQATYDSTHQVAGAIGITDEFGLVHWTTRLLVLQQELGGASAHARRVAAARRDRSVPPG
jgi:alkylation response protein AidB-like acyl-CoA dehydrogenase